jgi:hypothetical protein
MIRGQKIAAKRQQAAQGFKFDVMAAIHNRFDVEVIHPDGSKDMAVAHNIILDALWTRMSTSPAWFKSIAFGSGTGTLSAARTDLFTRISAKTADTLVYDYTHFTSGYVTFRQQIQIGAGEQTGQVLREVGIAYDNSANHLLTHALLKDMNGNTISITIGALDVINIYATVFSRFTFAGYIGGAAYFVNPGGSNSLSFTEHFLAVIAGVASSESWTIFSNLYAGYGEPYGALEPAMAYNVFNGKGSIGYKAVGTRTWTAATKKLNAKWSLAGSSRIGVGDLNSADGGWRWIAIRGNLYGANLMIKFPNSVKPYCTLTDESIGSGDGSNRDFACKFGFIMNDSSAVLKVGGATIDPSNYTIDYGCPPTTKLGYHLRWLSGVGTTQNYDGGGGSNWTMAQNDYMILENPYYVTQPLISFYSNQYIRVECSNDLTNWTVIHATGSASTVNVNASYQNYRYWKITAPLTGGSGGSNSCFKDIMTSAAAAKHIHFNAGQAPANGAAVTLTYRTASICKDTNHVVDIELEITLQEYNP